MKANIRPAGEIPMHTQVEVKTNNQLRELIDFQDLPEKIQKEEFDYIKEGEGFVRFFKYKGEYYDSHEFMVVNHGREALPVAFKGWSGYQSETFFSGLLIKFVDNDFENVVIGSYASRSS